ncbi:putative Zn-dependent protease with MMP-like domain [Aequitasia blattaphilus]|uniref:Metallopeptidase family protein n=1 Tax=Aequitasia blattaphilus TaxID=2949332 RepID=A0ABT1EB25_9FIRM|nr:metallopeptidase family protein [Aequitasia blattaphilus]MCP1102881.1 metallopeptidase family protein [Aequitasia blattaphilus]MCR8615521.1 metallopeptidase family protein [Aequitasia blattaphilus]
MIILEEFRDMLDSIEEEIPEEFFRELNGGILLMENEKIHPKSKGDELKIMGEYVRSHTMGRLIYIYYGSFKAVYRDASYEVLYKEVKHTLLHELTHHLESLAGYRDLEVEDEIGIHNYLKSKEEIQ